MNKIRRLAARLRHADDGVAAVEFSLLCAIFSAGLLNAGELSRYAFVSMQAANATQAGAAAALAACDVAHVPATVSCPGLNDAVSTALQGTSLGSHVALNGPLTEGYYCLNDHHVLVSVSGPSSPPADCSVAGNPSGVPALYLILTTTYTYTPMFAGLTVVDTLPHAVANTAWMRMK